MVVNSEGEEVNEDGTPLNDEQQETHDWTEVIELHNKTKLKPYSIEELATSSVPHNIPYLEVYRTDELWYKEYHSPYGSDVSVTDSSTSTSSESDTGSDGGDESSSSSSGGSASSSRGVVPKYSSKTKNGKLKDELKNIVKNNFKKEANHTSLVNRYMECKTNKLIIAGVTGWSSKWLKDGVNVKELNNSIYNAKHKYS